MTTDRIRRDRVLTAKFGLLVTDDRAEVSTGVFSDERLGRASCLLSVCRGMLATATIPPT